MQVVDKSQGYARDNRSRSSIVGSVTDLGEPHGRLEAQQLGAYLTESVLDPTGSHRPP
jgi:hypothetical protein